MQVAIQYFQVFLQTMAREWKGIDRLRLDKYMMLVRCFFTELFTLLAAHSWCAAPGFCLLRLPQLVESADISAAVLEAYLLSLAQLAGPVQMSIAACNELTPGPVFAQINKPQFLSPVVSSTRQPFLCF